MDGLTDIDKIKNKADKDIVKNISNFFIFGLPIKLQLETQTYNENLKS